MLQGTRNAQSSATPATTVRPNVSDDAIRTLNILRAILGLELEPVPKTSIRTTQSKKAPVVSKVPNTIKQRPPPKSSSTTRRQDDSVPGTLAQKRQFATDSFNCALKTLTSAAKTKQALAKASNESTNQPSSTSIRSSSALKNRSTNTKAVLDVAQLDGEDPKPLHMAAECANAALDCLIYLETQESIDESKTIVGLEKGGLILLDKFINLELLHHATHRAWQLRTLFLQRWKLAEESRDGAVETKVTSTPAYAIQFPITETFDQSALEFICSIQCQLLRLAILRGPSCINDRFLNSIETATPGSPADVILASLKNGFIDQETAGQRLRTVSLALSKLQHVCMEARSCSPWSIPLALTAYAVKIKSWQYLGHQADLQRELWQPLLRICKRSAAIVKKASSTALGQAESCMHSVKKSLKEAQLPQDIPLELLTMFRAFDGAKEGETQSHSVQPTNSDPIPSSGAALAAAQCRIMITHLAGFPEKLDTIVETAQSTLKALDQHLDGKMRDFDDLLVHGTKMRKTCADVIEKIDLQVSNAGNSTRYDECQSHLTRLVYTFLTFLMRYIDLPVFDKPNSAGNKNSSSAMTTIAKTIETILKLQKAEGRTSQALRKDTDGVLTNCVLLSRKTLEKIDGSGGPVFEYLVSLPARVSQLYWAKYLKAIEQRVSTSELINLLRCSISAIKSETRPRQQSALVSLKYEKLADHLSEVGDHYKSQEALKHVLQLTIEKGALSDVVHQVTNSSGRHVWTTPKTEAYMLGKGLERHIANCLQHNLPTVTACWFYDDSSLPIMDRCVLLERQIYACFGQQIRDAQKPLVESFIRFVLDLLDSVSAVCYRLRFLSQCLKLNAIKNSIAWDSLLNVDQINRFTSIECSPTPGDLNPRLAPALGLLVKSQWAIVTGTMDSSLSQQLMQDMWSQISLCHTAADIEPILDDSDAWLSQFVVIADHASILGASQARINALKCRARLLELQKLPVGLLVDNMVAVGSINLHLCQLSAAGKAFARAERYLADSDVPEQCLLQWAVAYAEYSREISNNAKALTLMTQAKTAFNKTSHSQQGHQRKDRLARESMVCRVVLLSSKLCFQQGMLEEASTYARQAVKLSTAIWLSVDKATKAQNAASTVPTGDASLQSLSDGFSKLTLAPATISATQTLGIWAWEHMDLHYNVLSHMAFITSHLGIYQDSVYYHEQALKIASSMKCQTRSGRSTSALMLHYARASCYEKAQNILDDIRKVSFVPCSSVEECNNLLDQAETYVLLGNVETGYAYFTKAVERYTSLQKETSTSLVGITTKTKVLQPLPNPPARPGRARSATTKSTRKPAKTVESCSAQPASDGVATSAAEPIIGWEMRTLGERLKTLGLEFEVHNKKFSHAVHIVTPKYGAREDTIKAALLFREALENFSSEAVQNVLVETAVGLPVRYKSSRESGRTSFVRNPSPVKAARSRQVGIRSAPNAQHDDRALVSSGPQLLSQAQQLLAGVGNSQMTMSMLDTIHSFHKIYARLALFSAASQQPLVYSSLSLAQQALCAKDVALHRERYAIQAEIQTTNRNEIHAWPEISLLSVRDTDSGKANEFANSIASLPESWSVVSIELSDDRTELLVSRIVRDQSPFIMRLPLSRANLDEGDEHDFDFETAMAEIMEIVKFANSTAHDSRGQGDSQTRKAWYAEREALDQRLELWLNNVENLWLGGFRGLLNSYQTDGTHLSLFGQALSQILDNHLPSRQKQAKSSTRVELHAHVLDLFASIGHPDHEEIDDAVTDLLYFVIDVLQFNGERNAYDEIDFDVMLVDTLDAIRQHHERAASQSGEHGGHLVLVLDKELQAFPWESIPYLRNRAVSRMPSLGSIFERLKKHQTHESSPDVLRISSSRGAYMLNPSSDLTSTQTTFSTTLSTQLPLFKGITDRLPTEAEFESCLHDNDLFLYIGHGSGAQYIRGRNIRKMDQCAVTWLMGCSSAKMTECGAFESYGMPLNYMHAGSLAVVGTLWDVTDRDIDRFAMTALVEWGLLEEDEMVKEAISKKKRDTKTKSKGKAKELVAKSDTSLKPKEVKDENKPRRGETRAQKKGNVSICQAVTKARGACALKYINGAAPVIYGLPVALE